MKRYILIRSLQSLVTICLVIFVVFMLLRLMPTSGYFTREDFLNMSEEMRTVYLKNLGVLDPPLTQFKNFIVNLFQGDLGRSITVYPKLSISTILEEKIGFSAAFGLASMIISMGIGMPLGMLMARYKNRLPDHFGTGYAVIVRSIPSLIYLFLVQVWVSKIPGRSWWRLITSKV